MTFDDDLDGLKQGFLEHGGQKRIESSGLDAMWSERACRKVAHVFGDDDFTVSGERTGQDMTIIRVIVTLGQMGFPLMISYQGIWKMQAHQLQRPLDTRCDVFVRLDSSHLLIEPLTLHELRGEVLNPSWDQVAAQSIEDSLAPENIEVPEHGEREHPVSRVVPPNGTCIEDNTRSMGHGLGSSSRWFARPPDDSMRGGRRKRSGFVIRAQALQSSRR